MINPFSTKFPVSPNYFINREKELSAFKEALEASFDKHPPRPENLAILGDWGVGKTSILTKFQDIALNECKDRKLLCVNLSLPSTIADTREFVADFIEKIYEVIVSENRLSAKIRDEIFSWRVKSLSLGPLAIEKEKKEFKVSAGAQLRKSLVELWQNYFSDFDIIILMLDDLHYLVRSIPEGLYDLRTVFQELPEYGCNYLLIVTGPKVIFSKIRDIAEPLVRFFDQYEIGCFNLEETKKAILTPLRVGGIPVDIGRDVIERIFSLTQGHPYFISFVMHDLLQKRSRGRIDIPFFDRVFDNILSRLHRIKFEMDYGIASDGEKRILKALANSENERVKIMELKIAGLKRSSLSKTMERLIEKDLLVKVERGEYALYHPLFKQFLLKK